MCHLLRVKLLERGFFSMEFDESMWLAMADTDFGVADHRDKEYHPKPYEIVSRLQKRR